MESHLHQSKEYGNVSNNNSKEENDAVIEWYEWSYYGLEVKFSLSTLFLPQKLNKDRNWGAGHGIGLSRNIFFVSWASSGIQ